MKTAQCPRCNRAAYLVDGRIKEHAITAGRRAGACPMTGQRQPVTGVSWDAYAARAELVADLAEQVQDADPAVVWQYLTALPADELQRLLMVSLAGIPVDRTVDDIFGWVHQLPVAKGVCA